jgi:succinoglycan biosynthesis transport protein ExoP
MFQSHAVEVRDLGRLILRRRRVVLLAVIVCVGLALALNTFTRPVYRTASRLQIEPTPSRSPITGAEVETPTSASENLTLLTTAERILTRDVVEKVVNEVQSRGVALDPKVADPQQAALMTPDMRLRANVDWLQRAVSVRPIRDTRLVDIQAEHSDPRAAADLANTVAKVFLASEAQARQAADRGRLESLRAQIADVRHVIEVSEQSLYGSKHTNLAISGERNRQLAQAGTELGSSVLKARGDLHDVEAQLERIRQFKKSDAPDWSNPPVQTPALDDRYRDLQKVETQLLAMRQVYKDGSPELLALESQSRALRETMRRELQKAQSDLEGQREVLATRVADLDHAIGRNDVSLKALSDSSTKYSTLESELGTQRELYTLLLKKAQEQDIAQTIQPPSVVVVQDAAVPLEPVRPRKVMNLVVGALLGLVFGSGLALALETFRRTIRTPRDVVRELQLPVVGMIPRRAP